MSKKITVWESWNHKTEKWSHNHIEDGWSDGAVRTDSSKDVPHMWLENRPTGTEQQTKAWRGQKWRKEHVYLVDGVVVKSLEKEVVLTSGYTVEEIAVAMVGSLILIRLVMFLFGVGDE